jgi:D-citramalate synthase
MKKNIVESYVLSCEGFETFHNSLFKIDGEVIEEHGDGQFDAFMNALAKIYKSKELHYPN